MKLCGYNGRILLIDLGEQRTWVTEPPVEFYRRYAGGGLMAAYYLLNETGPGVDPLGPGNLLCFFSSIIAGVRAPGLARFTVAAKSPLTGGIGEARCEGLWGIKLKESGYDGIICYGVSEKPVALVVDNGRAKLVEASHLWGKTVGETTDVLEQKYGSDSCVLAIGSAGENRVRFASIVSDRCNQAARTGMGAVMGSKLLKAVVLKGTDAPQVADPAHLEEIRQIYAQQVYRNVLTRWQAEPPGFSCWVHTHGLDAALCVNNYQTAQLDDADAYKPEEFMKYYKGAKACPGCPNDCIKVFDTGTGLDPKAGGIHQEITGSMGPNLGISHLPTIFDANNLCNQLGLDPNSLGYVISFAMECAENNLLDTQGMSLEFGNHTHLLDLIRQIAYREGIGDLLAEGTKRAAEQLGSNALYWAMQVKGNEMVPFEPRSQTNLALGYATAPVGPRYEICEHDWDFDTNVGWEHTLEYTRTLGILSRIPMQYVGPGKVRNYKVLNNLWSAADALNLCIFASAPTRILSLEQMAGVVKAITGWETSSYEVMRWGERRNHLMRVYNNREGLTFEDDTLPKRFFIEPIDAGALEGTVLSEKVFKEAIQVYYEMMGWNSKGEPLPATLYDHGLEWTIPS